MTEPREADAMIAAGKTVAQIVQALSVWDPTFRRWGLRTVGRRPSRPVADQALEVASAMC